MDKFILITTMLILAGAIYIFGSLMMGLSPELIRSAMPGVDQPVHINGKY